MFFSNAAAESTPEEHDFRDLSKEGQTETFRESAKKMVDYICEYTLNSCKMPVFPDVEPGFLRPLFPDLPPDEPEDFNKILKDFDEKVLPGTLHWRHPDLYGYLSCGNALPNILGDMLSTACGGLGFSWTAQPALTEMENLMMDWMGRALHLPSKFLCAESNGKGGGSTQASASDSVFNTIIAARYAKLKELGSYSQTNCTSTDDPVHPSKFLGKLIAYTSIDSHSCVQKGANIAMVEIRVLQSDQNHQITGKILEDAILEDKANGRIPFYFCGCFGSTGVAVVDDNASIGPVCKKYGLWFHVDAAYAGSALLLPEMAHFLEGLEYVDSIDMSPYKLFLGSIDSGVLWLADVETYKEPWTIEAAYLIESKGARGKTDAITYRHYGVPLARRFRVLKFYFLMRMLGIKGLQDYQRRVLHLAKYFESLVRADDRFVVTSKAAFGVFCFRQKSPIEKQLNFNELKSDCPMSYTNLLNMNLLYRINKSRKIHLVPYIFDGLYHLRISINYEFATEDDIRRAWGVIQSCYVAKLDEEWEEKREKKSPAEEKRLKQMKSQFSFVNVVEGGAEDKKLRLQPTFGQYSVCEDTTEPEQIVRN